jgi:hypothetical protein
LEGKKFVRSSLEIDINEFLFSESVEMIEISLMWFIFVYWFENVGGCEKKLSWWRERMFGENWRKIIEKFFPTELEYLERYLEKAMTLVDAWLIEVLQIVFRLLETVSDLLGLSLWPSMFVLFRF